MGNGISNLIACALLGAAPILPCGAASSAPFATGLSADAAAPAAPVPGDWIVEEGDNVCGLKDARQLQNPAAVDYDVLIEATPESKEMKRKGIDKDSPEGQVLHNKAVDRVRVAACEHMKAKGYDSVWKSIKHRRGLKAPDLTDELKKVVEKAGAGSLHGS